MSKYIYTSEEYYGSEGVILKDLDKVRNEGCVRTYNMARLLLGLAEPLKVLYVAKGTVQ
jgi:hypothetical protein